MDEAKFVLVPKTEFAEMKEERIQMKNKSQQDEQEKDELKNEIERLKAQLQEQTSQSQLGTTAQVPCPRFCTPQEQVITSVFFCLSLPTISYPTCEYTCCHSCVVLSLAYICWQKKIPFCLSWLIKNAAFFAPHKEFLDCEKAVSLLINLQVLTHVKSIRNIENDLPRFNEVLIEVTENETFPDKVGMLAFDYHSRSIGHTVCFEKVDNQHLQIWDQQKRNWWSEEDYNNIKAVHCYQVNTTEIANLHAPCLSDNMDELMEISHDGIEESNGDHWMVAL